MSQETRLRWGILGCARITRRGLAPGIRASTTGVLHALASRDAAVAREWAAEFGRPRAHGSYEELLADPEVDAVYIPLPNELHRPWVTAAADAGKHVLCEKPLALDAREARAMVQHCRARGVLLMEAFMWRHQPRSLELRRLIRGGAIGELRLIRSSFSFPIAGGDWRLDPARGGGSLWDVGCYGVSAARFFAGAEPLQVRAIAHSGPSGVDRSFTALLEFPLGVLAAVDCSFEQPYRCSCELVGNRGVVEVPDAYLPPSGGADGPAADDRCGLPTPARPPTTSGPWSSTRSTSMPPWSTPSLARSRRAPWSTPPRTGWPRWSRSTGSRRRRGCRWTTGSRGGRYR